jgi:hypothetical protein
MPEAAAGLGQVGEGGITVPWWVIALVGGGAGIVGFGLGVLGTMMWLLAWGAAKVEMAKAQGDEGLLGEGLGWEQGRAA